ncbi:MAG: proline--tRNA ligase [Candidatus Omnitrophota bacterium]
MFYSKMFIPTSREDPKDAECASHKLGLKASLLFMYSAGIYAYLPLGLRVLSKIEDIIRKRMNEHGACELFMPALQPLEIWKQTGRDKVLEDVMFTFKDRKGRILCLGPTHEEAVTEIVKRFVTSYKQLPLILYQIQTKFRDEIRPRFGLIRSCEFVMKDAYSFDLDQDGLNRSYDKMFTAYNTVFNDCGVSFVISEADSGAMGGSVSHEFMVAADIGEDILYSCSVCGTYFKQDGKCSNCKNKLEESRMIEVGHVFKLGAKYSQTQNACVLDSLGRRIPVIMGCYGIGVSRLISAIIEQNHDDRGIIWPKGVSPFDAALLLLERDNDYLYQEAFSLYENLSRERFDILFDDRGEGPGVKFNDAYLVGSPFIIIIGKRFLKEKKFELEVRRNGEKKEFTKDQLINFLKDQHDK